MTLQVCLVGTDGIVLASDRKTLNPFPVRQSSLTTKIEIQTEKGLAVAWAGHEITTHIGKGILKEFKDEWRAFPIIPLEDLSSRIAKARRREYCNPRLLEGQVTFVTRADLSKFLVLEIIGSKAQCTSCLDKRVTGDKGNPAIYFSQGYYERAPISKLVRLAAQIIVAGSRFNRDGIEGLQILLCKDSGFQFVPDDQIESLTKESEKLEDEIKTKLCVFATDESAYRFQKSPKDD